MQSTTETPAANLVHCRADNGSTAPPPAPPPRENCPGCQAPLPFEMHEYRERFDAKLQLWRVSVTVYCPHCSRGWQAPLVWSPAQSSYRLDGDVKELPANCPSAKRLRVRAGRMSL